MVMSRCGGCPGFCRAGSCGMVQLGPRTCGVKIGGIEFIIDYTNCVYETLYGVGIFHGGFCADTGLYYTPFTGRPRWETLPAFLLSYPR